MDLELSEDQKLFRNTTVKFLENEAPIEKVRELNKSGEGFPRDFWSQGAELGWAALLVPEDLGGGSISGDGFKDLAIVAEEFGRLTSPGPIIAVNVVIAGLVEGAASGPDHSGEIEGLMSGESIGTWAAYEPNSQWDPLNPSTTAAANAGNFVITGVKDRIEVGADADVFLVSAKTDAGIALFLVPADAAGVTVEKVDSLDFVRQYATARFDGVTVPAEAMVGTEATAAEITERMFQVAVALQCAETNGAIDKVFEFTVQWAFDRYSFGRPLASYQALKHRFSDMRTWLECCMATTDAAVQAVNDRDPEAGRLVSIAKAYVGTKAVQIVQDCVQMHGGLGVTWEHDIHLYLRRVMVDRQLYGTPSDHKRRISDLIGL
ncbi:MAG: acyl-CoA dehydrogenase family protein [Actinomycetota bacterium]|nr:acyl-CoA dehydrogenase family protein [Actinomycetota bacterium]